MARTRGQRAGLTRAAILEAAVRLADREGLSALSMRRLGAELGVEAMTLYHHVPNKEALLDGMVEQVASEAAPPDFDPDSWEQAMRDYAHALLAALCAHPHVVPLFVSRPAITPRNMQTMEAALAALQAAGFDPLRAFDMVRALTGFILGHVATQSVSEPAGAAPQEDSWPEALAAIDPDAYPLLAHAHRAGQAHDAATQFDFALEALISGFDAARVR